MLRLITQAFHLFLFIAGLPLEYEYVYMNTSIYSSTVTNKSLEAAFGGQVNKKTRNVRSKFFAVRHELSLSACTIASIQNCTCMKAYQCAHGFSSYFIVSFNQHSELHRFSNRVKHNGREELFLLPLLKCTTYKGTFYGSLESFKQKEVCSVNCTKYYTEYIVSFLGQEITVYLLTLVSNIRTYPYFRYFCCWLRTSSMCEGQKTLSEQNEKNGYRWAKMCISKKLCACTPYSQRYEIGEVQNFNPEKRANLSTVAA